MYVDVHAHLHMCPPSVIDDARAAGVRHIITTATDVKSAHKSVELGRTHDIVHAAVGIYPGEEGDIDSIRLLADDAVTIGECGLDYHITDDPLKRSRQEKVFIAMIKLAQERDLPLIVHSRKAEERTIEILEEMKATRIVMHCFEGKKSLIDRVIANGWHLTATTNIARSDQVATRVAKTPLRQLLTETDSPFMGPVRGVENSPATIPVAITEIAAIKEMDATEVAHIIYMNYRKLFR